MTVGNRIFWAIIGFIGIHFLFLGYLENFIPLWIATVLGLAWVIYFIGFGPKPKEKNEEKGA